MVLFLFLSKSSEGLKVEKHRIEMVTECLYVNPVQYDKKAMECLQIVFKNNVFSQFGYKPLHSKSLSLYSKIMW